MAEALVRYCARKGETKILEHFVGKDLEYKEYEPLFDFVKPDKKCWYVTCDTLCNIDRWYRRGTHRPRFW